MYDKKKSKSENEYMFSEFIIFALNFSSSQVFGAYIIYKNMSTTKNTKAFSALDQSENQISLQKASKLKLLFSK